jgi:putative DNA primase/helicase
MNQLTQHVWLGRMSRGDNVHQTRWRTRECHPYGIDGLISLLDPGEIAPEERRNPKDGPCFVPGVLAPLPSGEYALRQRDRVTEVNVLIADLDIGTPFASLQSRLQAVGVLALVTPTWSHLRRFYAFRVAPARWQAYLAAFGSAEAAVLAQGATLFLPGIVAGGLAGPVSIAPVDKAKPGGALIVSYSWAQPVPRWRVAVPLARGWAAEGGPSTATADAWAQRYHELTEALGLWDCDPSCADASRLFFTARWPAAWPVTESDPAWATAMANLAPGEPGPDRPLARIEGAIADLPGLLAHRDRLSWTARLGKAEDRLRRDFEATAHTARQQLPQISGTKGRRKPGAPRALIPWLVRHPESGESIDLTRWHQGYGWGLELATLIQQEHPELLAERGEGAGGNLHIVCPASDLHGTDRDDGTFVWDGDGWSARGRPGARRGGLFCNHTACSGRSAGENLALLLDAGVLSWERLAAIEARGQTEKLAALTEISTEGDSLDDQLESGMAPSRPLAEQEAEPDSESSSTSRRPVAAPLLDPATPLISAQVLVSRHFTRAGTRALQHHQGVFHHWTGTHYREIADEEVVARVYRFLEHANRLGKDGMPEPFNPNLNKVTEVIGALRAVAQLPRTVQPPVWLGAAKPEVPPGEVLACENGLLHWPTRTLLAHTPAFFGLNSVPYAYQPESDPPVAWLRFLAELWPNDQASIGTLQELFGLLLTPDTSYQKMFLLIGPKRSGRGTIARILSAMLGHDNVAGPTLSSLVQTFGLQDLLGKSVAIIGDARLGVRTDIAAIVERLLTISGEDRLSVPRKHLTAWHGTLSARILLLTNLLPKMTDTGGALASRFIVLRLVTSFYGREDRRLLSRLLPELPGILNWALEGLDRLTRRGYFQQPKSAASWAQDLADTTTPLSRFLRERCRVRPGGFVECRALYFAWCDWCRSNGEKQVGTTQDLGTALRALVPGVTTGQRRDPTDWQKRLRVYVGLELLSTPDAESADSATC